MQGIFSLVYGSRELIDFSTQELSKLAFSAAESNRQRLITGYLYYHNGRFLQYLEGHQQAVTSLMARIAGDDRHALLRVVELGDGVQRLFPDWNMRLVEPSKLIETGLHAGLATLLDTLVEHDSVSADLSAEVRNRVLHLAERRTEYDAVAAH